MDCIMEPEVITIEDVEPLWIGFINCGRKNIQSALSAYNQLKERSDNWVLGLNDVNYKHLKDLITDDNVQFFFANGRNKVALLASREHWQLIWDPNDMDMVSITNSSRKKKLIITCALMSRPKATLSLKKKEQMIKSYCRMVRLHTNCHQVLMGDVNSCSYTWTMDNTDSVGKLIADTVIDLCFENALTSNYHNWTRLDLSTSRKSWIDAIFVDDELNKNLSKAAAIDLFEIQQRMILAEINGENICEPLEKSKSKSNTVSRVIGPAPPVITLGTQKVKLYKNVLEKIFVITEAHKVPKIVFLNQMLPSAIARLGRLHHKVLRRLYARQRNYPKCVMDLRSLCMKTILIDNRKKIAKFFDYGRRLVTNEALE
ncbi:uncharacterized protein LOC141848908 [Brevipalpus obovatus]|uniref:uncharacterized protein LOC141848908 n=1 Tax=Brevipalpus obovatus TaxID=246614 RepID=UPI003D9F2058